MLLMAEVYTGAAMPESVDPKRLRLTNEDGSEGVLLGFRCGACASVIYRLRQS